VTSVSGSHNEVGRINNSKGKMGQELAQITYIHDSIATWREDSKYLNYIITCLLQVYPRCVPPSQ
jgi:hypothetical protein